MIDDCWNKIGVHGDSSCLELKKYVHCRNCPVYSGAALELLDVELPAGYLSHWTGHIAQQRPAPEPDAHSVIVFRVDADRMALPTAVFKEIAGMRAIHTLPQRRGGLVLGIANVRGQLSVCISLRWMLGLDNTQARREGKRAVDERLLVLECDGKRIVCPVDEVYGVHRYHPRELAEVPATLAKAAAAYTKAVLTWQKKPVALLDDQLLFYSFERSLASTTT